MQRRKPIEEELIEAIDEALREHSLGILRFLELERERRGWRCSYRQARHAYDDWVSSVRPHAFDVRSLANVVRVVGHARWLDVLLGEEQRIQRERRMDDRIGPKRVESRRRKVM